MKIIRILPINQLAIYTKLKPNERDFLILTMSYPMLFLIFCFSVTLSQHVSYYSVTLS